MFTGLPVTAGIVTLVALDHFGLAGFEHHSAGLWRIVDCAASIGGLVVVCAVRSDMSLRPGPISRRYASLRIRTRRLKVDAHLDVEPLRLVAIGILVAGVLWSVPPIIRAARARRSPADS